MKNTFGILAGLALVSLFSCGTKSSPSPSSTKNYGTWTENGTSFTSEFTSVASSAFVALASKPHSSTFEIYFSSATPAAGSYSITPFGNTLASNQTSIVIVDGTLPGGFAGSEFSSGVKSTGNVTVSVSGTTTTITIPNVKVYGSTDSVTVSGTIIKP